jgi:uncharacterized membrane protein YbhN (UPF0104 family)
MRSLNRHPRVALLLSALIAGGTVAAIAAADRPRALWHALEQFQPQWLLAALGAELLAYLGYVLAYRSLITAPRSERLSLMLTIRLVLAGFGPFVPQGGFGLDRLALRSVHRSRRRARVQVLGLGAVEYVLLAPAAFVCASIIFFGSSRSSPALTLPWIVSVPPGLLLGWLASRPRVRARFERSCTRGGRRLGDVLAGVGVFRKVVLQPLERPWALPGMTLYWAAEIACLGFSLRCFEVHISLPALILAYATGYAASRRSLPFGGAGITEALLTVSLIAVHVRAAEALVSVLAYRVVNFLIPIVPALLAHSSLEPLLEDLERPRGGAGEQRPH